MTDKRRRDDDLIGLSEAEARELGEVADALRAHRREPDDPDLWSALEQRIMNEVAVTPIPGRQGIDESDKQGLLARLRQLFQVSWRRSLASAALAAAAAVALTLLVLSKDSPQGPSDEPANPEAVANPDLPGPDSPFDRREPLQIPDELWHDGFLQHRALDLSAEIDLAEDGGVVDGEWDLDEDDDVVDDYDDVWAVSEWPEDGLAADPFEAELGWGLGALDDEELLLLDELLGG